ncbi:hypothetical protein [Nocardia sp. NPDC020380]|uniref:hypothetical protein n=1 Tax=Nocardia sp. NPDC020380 TaxID=3364309 RepID=UPI0037A7179A
MSFTHARTRRPLALAGVLAVTTLGLADCGGGSDSPGGAPTGPPQAGGTLRYGLSQAPTCSDPAVVGGAAPAAVGVVRNALSTNSIPLERTA